MAAKRSSKKVVDLKSADPRYVVSAGSVLDATVIERLRAGETLIINDEEEPLGVMVPEPYFQFLMGLLAEDAHRRAQEVPRTPRVKLRSWEEVRDELCPPEL